MDSFNSQKTKSRKIKRLAKKSRVQIILDLFYRAIEIVLVLITVAKLCYQLVITLHDSGVTVAIIANRNLAFATANSIVIALIAKSGLLLNQKAVTKSESNDLYVEFVHESSRRDEASRPEMRNRVKQSEAENKAKQSITKQSKAEKQTQSITETIPKQSISEKEESKPEKATKQRTSMKREKKSIVELLEHQETTVMKMEKQKRQSQSYQRSRSENLEGLEKSSSCGRLRRSETDASSERFDSDDELRYKIESFIARQRRNQTDD